MDRQGICVEKRVDRRKKGTVEEGERTVGYQGTMNYELPYQLRLD
jgi:hypothetical protein